MHVWSKLIITFSRPDGQKKAYVRLASDYDALDVANKVCERMNHTITFEKILWSLKNFSQFWGFVISFLLLFCRLGSSKLVKKTNNKIWLLFKLKRVFCVLLYLAFCFMNFVSVCFLSKWQIFLQESSSRFKFISLYQKFLFTSTNNHEMPSCWKQVCYVLKNIKKHHGTDHIFVILANYFVSFFCHLLFLIQTLIGIWKSVTGVSINFP